MMQDASQMGVGLFIFVCWHFQEAPFEHWHGVFRSQYCTVVGTSATMTFVFLVSRLSIPIKRRRVPIHSTIMRSVLSVFRFSGTGLNDAGTTAHALRAPKAIKVMKRPYAGTGSGRPVVLLCSLSLSLPDKRHDQH